MGKLPGFTFYPGDWLKDPELRRCSKAAKGVWIDMLCLMFECPIRGVFSTGGLPWSDEDIAAAIGGDIGSNLGCIAELVSKGVAQRDSRGAIFSRRMVRDEQSRQATRERVMKHRSNGQCNATVTPVYVSEDEEEVGVVVGSKSRPSFEEVKAYCLERDRGIDPQKWFDHYTANGWKVGRNSMRDWKAAVRTWESNSGKPPTASPLTPEEAEWAQDWRKKEQARIAGRAVGQS